MGCLFCCEFNDENRSPYLSLLSLRSERTIWQQEMYKEIELSLLDDYFIAFEGSYDVFGLSFAEECNAGQFYKQLQNILGKKTKGGNGNGNARKKKRVQKKKKMKITKKKSQRKLKDDRPSSVPVKKKKKKKENGHHSRQTKSRGLFSKIFGGKEEVVVRAVIGAPKNFSHSMHIGVVPGKGFVTQDLPDEWKAIFQDAGIAKEEYENPEKAQKMMKAIKRFKKKKKRKKRRGGAKGKGKGRRKKKGQRRRPRKKGAGGGGGRVRKKKRVRRRPQGRSRAHGGGLPNTPQGYQEEEIFEPEVEEFSGPPPPGPPPMDFDIAVTNNNNSGGGGAPDLMAEIRQGTKLKKVESIDLDVRDLGQDDRNDLMSVLKNSILNRHDAMDGESEDSEDDDDDWGDDDAEEEDWGGGNSDDDDGGGAAW